MEVLGTLVGAAIQGQIVASAHTLKHCPTQNASAGHLGNDSRAEVIKSLVRSQEYLAYSVSGRRPACAPRRKFCGVSRAESGLIQRGEVQQEVLEGGGAVFRARLWPAVARLKVKALATFFFSFKSS